MNLVSERKFLKNFGQLSDVKFVERLVSNGVGVSLLLLLLVDLWDSAGWELLSLSSLVCEFSSSARRMGE